MTVSEPAEDTAAKADKSSPWRDVNFRLLAVGTTASDLGFQIALVAVPLVAVTTLGATSFQVGVLRGVGQLPYPIFVLFVGVYADRWRRRNMLVGADLGRALALIAVPVVFAAHSLGIPVLYVVEFVVGFGTVLFDVGSLAYLPRLIDRQDLAQANSIVQSAQSAALIFGPVLGGVFVSLLMPPRAVIACVVCFLLSTFTIWRIRKSEPRQTPSGGAANPFPQIKEGIAFVTKNPVLRAIAIISGVFNFCYAGYLALYLVFLPKELQLPGYAIGIALAATGPGFLVGAIMSSWLPRRFGYGPVLIVCSFLSVALLLGVPALHGRGFVTLALLVLLNFLYGCLAQTFTVALVSIRQAITPDQVLGRVMATLRFLGVGLIPLGSLVGGVLGSTAGVRAGLLILAIVMCAVPVPFALSRSALTRIGKELPEAVEMPASPDLPPPPADLPTTAGN
ncbi:MAG TPA: MFS transporter [Streptosporangiaceae bacterium]|nr:MFS transporter [Streptosporangiaceae bacterium]